MTTAINNQPDLTILEESIGIAFTQKDLLATSLTHRSFLNESEKGTVSNERMEFLGDSILAFWASTRIYRKFPSLPEGKLTFIRTHLVRTETLARLAKSLELGKYMRMSRGEEQGGGRENPLLLANCFEALIGAVFLDQGIETASRFLEKQIGPILEKVKDPDLLKDNKSLLQEKIQAEGKPSPVYKLISAIGPDHAKTFTMGVYDGEKLLAEGSGASKQEAEERAAQKALEQLCA